MPKHRFITRLIYVQLNLADFRRHASFQPAHFLNPCKDLLNAFQLLQPLVKADTLPRKPRGAKAEMPQGKP